ncbi:phage tail protein [Qipengyuania sp. ASV99]|uniref:GTA baseplate fiber-binding domain-containing protein n=1 Tax=Qipengyuania sp. ASV99 TaxID=3399681 RepID=UPI003A4C64CF
MATLILTAVGTAIGGPIGGAIGAFIGRQTDAAIFGGGSREGPRLRELSVTTSSYGQPIPRQFGRMRVAGTVIWSTELIESTSRQGGGKGKPSTKTFSYSASFAVALSSTPIDRIGRIWADGNLLRGASGDLKVEGIMRTYCGKGDDAIDPLIAADRGNEAPAFRDCAYAVFEDLQLGDFGNRIPALTFEVFAPQDTEVSLGQLVPHSMNVSGDIVLENARGFSDEGGAIGSSLAAIDRVFPLSCVTTADGLQFASTSALPSDVPTLPEQLSQRDSEDADTKHKKRSGRVDRQPLALRYYDEGRDYQPGVQRALGMRADGRESIVDLPAAMTAQGARQLANSNAHRSRWHEEQVVWRIGTLDPKIGPGSVVRVPETSGYWLVKSWEWFDRGIELGLERLAPELGTIVPSDAGAANTPVDLAAPATLLTALETPPSGTADTTNPAIFAAATANSAGWRGAALFIEQGSALVGIGSTDGVRSIFGTLAAPLGGSPSTLIETSAAFDIDLPDESLSFSSTDMTGIAMGQNRLMLGGELLQFLNAEPLGANRWRLSGLLRGRAGTEDAAALGHTAGTLAVLIDDSLTALDNSLVPSAAGTRIAAIGRGDTVPVYASLQNVGLSRRPPRPVHPRADVLPDGSWRLCWTRRARGQWTWPDGIEVPIVEEHESYTISFGAEDTAFAVWTLSTANFLISSAERSDLLTQFGAGSLWVRQSGTYGQSSPLHLITIT